MDDPRRRTPRTDTVLADPAVSEAVLRLGRPLVKQVVGNVLEACRRGAVHPDRVIETTLDSLPATTTTLREVVNATGVVLHTNLGRAPLSAAAVTPSVSRPGPPTSSSTWPPAGGPARAGALAALAAAVPDAAAVHVVNNGAAALVLVASALAQGREIVVSRGELVEIGDGFRLPDLLESTGRRLREVGTTNRTRAGRLRRRDRRPTPAFVLKVHPSNFRVAGFTSVGRRRRAGHPGRAGGRRHRLRAARPDPLLPDEPDAASCLRAGAALVTASGDKLLGGPQAGLLLGGHDLVERLRRHPLRPGAAGRQAHPRRARGHPAPGRPRRPAAGAARRPGRAARAGRRSAGRCDRRRRGGGALARAVVGGGGAPGVDAAQRGGEPCRRASPSRCASAPSPWSAGCEGGRLLLDLRCVPPDRDDAVAEAVRRVVAAAAADPPDVHVVATAGPRRPRQVDARARAHRDGARPAGRGAPPRADHRPRLRLDRPAVRRRRRVRRRARARAVRPEHARRGRSGARRAVRGRRRRGLDAAVRRAPGRAGRARRAARPARGDPRRPRRPGAGAEPRPRRASPHLAGRRGGGRGQRRHRRRPARAAGRPGRRRCAAAATRPGAGAALGRPARSHVRGSGTVVTGTLAGRHRLRSATSSPPPASRSGSAAWSASGARPDGGRGRPGRGEPARAGARDAHPRRRPAQPRRVPAATDLWTSGSPATERVPDRPVLHVGSPRSPSTSGRSPTTGPARLDRPLPLRIGDRALLRDPGSRASRGVTVLDVAPPPLRRRGAAAPGPASCPPRTAAWPPSCPAGASPAGRCCAGSACPRRRSRPGRRGRGLAGGPREGGGAARPAGPGHP